MLGLDAGSLLPLMVYRQCYLEIIPATAVPRDQLYFYRPDVQEGIDDHVLAQADGTEEYISVSTPEELDAFFASLNEDNAEEGS